MSKLVKDETKRLLEVINEQVENLLSYDNQIPIIEIDLTKESIRKLYQQLDYLAKPLDKNIELEKIINKTNQETEDLIKKADEEFEINKEKEDKSEAKDNKIEKSDSNHNREKGKTEEKTHIDKPKVEESTEANKAKKKSNIDKPKIDKEDSDKISAPKKPQHFQRSIIDVVASEEETNLGDTFQESNITNLKSAIGINDKFQFINELFEGSMSNYNAFIKKVDSLNKKEEAIKEFEEAKNTNNWNKEEGAYQLMENYIKRRFPQ